jgi:hypothetical protein
MEINVSKDTPLSEIKDDAFHREPIVNTVVKVINNLCTQNENCFNIGIFGKWGEGKTTVLNFIKQKLLNQKDNIIIAEFNPWFFKDDESLYLDFFRTISSQSPDKKLAGVIKKYAPIVSLGLSGLSKIAALALPPAEIALKTGANIFDHLSGISNNKSVSELKKDIDTAIDESKKHYVIFIDDLDRLDKQELHSVLNLIKHTANFHNTIYIVAMDKDMVARSLNTEYDEEDNKNSGYDFLEKIFQLQIELPKIPSYRLYNSLMERITPLFEQCSLSNDKIGAIKTDCRQVVGPVLDSAREIVLISNILWAYLPLVYENVDVPDFCILQVLKVLSPAMYQMIRNNKKRLVSKEIVVNPDMAYHNREPFYEDLKKNLNYDNQYDNVIRRLLGFPPFNLQETSRSLCTEFFDRYFVYEIGDESPKEDDVLKLSQSMDKDIPSILTTMYEIHDNYGNIGLQIAFHEIVSEGSQLLQSSEEVMRLANSIAMYYKRNSFDPLTLDESSVRWDMEIVRIFNLLKVIVDANETMSDLIKISNVASPNFYISTLLCYYDEGVYGKTAEFKQNVAEYMDNLLEDHNKRDFLFKINGRAIKLFYPFLKEVYPEDYEKMTSRLYYPDYPDYLLIIMKVFFGTIQKDKELEQSYNSYKDLFDVKKTFEVCSSKATKIYIEIHKVMKLCVDQFNKMYGEKDVGKID